MCIRDRSVRRRVWRRWQTRAQTRKRRVVRGAQTQRHRHTYTQTLTHRHRHRQRHADTRTRRHAGAQRHSAEERLAFQPRGASPRESQYPPGVGHVQL
eukprot:4624686-Alexandrium_andersonii.AAC.1